MSNDAVWEFPEFDALLDSLVPFAQEMLQRAGEFYPFGGVVDAAGRVGQIAADTGEEHPISSTVFEFLIGALKASAQKEGHRATGVCVDVRVKHPATHEKLDAIQVALDHDSGAALDFFLPYRKDGTTIEYLEPFGIRANARVFAVRDEGRP